MVAGLVERRGTLLPRRLEGVAVEGRRLALRAGLLVVDFIASFYFGLVIHFIGRSPPAGRRPAQRTSKANRDFGNFKKYLENP
jgi:hypothetical protein